MASQQSWLDAFRIPPCAAVGLRHTVALTDSSSVIVFGANRQGQLGLDDVVNAVDRPKLVPDPKTNDPDRWKTSPIQVACGAAHTIVLLATGELYAWGLNANRRLGLSPARESGGDGRGGSYAGDNICPRPQRIDAFGSDRTVKYIACGTDHTLCIDSNGDTWSWGIGSYGNLGHGSNRDEPFPRAIAALQGKVACVVAGGAKHSACVTRKGELFTWGHGDKGRLGNGAQRGTSSPELVHTLTQAFVVTVACGEAHTACISDAGELFTWGAGSYGRLGHGEESDALVPVKVEGLARHQVVQVSLGVFHSVAVTKDGVLFTWGGGQFGKLGHGTEENCHIPTQVQTALLNDSNVLQAFAGSSHTVAVCRNGALFTWGDAVQGKLGLGEATSSTAKPLRVDLSFRAGMRVAPPHSPLLETDSRTWPSSLTGTSGQATQSLVPHGLDQFAATVRQVAVGSKHSMAVTFGGALFAWGGNEFGQVGNGSREDVQVPTRVKLNRATTLRIEHVAAGANHSICCVSQGDVYAWGRGNEAQIGTGSTITETSPVLIQGLQGQRISQVFAAETHSAALSDDGKLFTWGDSDFGKLGHGRSFTESDPKYDTVSLPRIVKGALVRERVVKVSLGTSHSACIDATGKVYTWGAGWQGKLGLGNTDNQYSPQRVIALQFHVCRDVSCGAYHTMFVTEVGDLYVCGRGDARLGLGDTTDKLVPELNSALRAEAENVIVQACASEEHSMVLTSRGRVYAWGRDLYGKLGLGGSTSRSADYGYELAGQVRIESVPLLIPTNALNLGVFSQSGENSVGDIRSLVSSANHCLALAQDSTVYGWGSNGSGRLGLSERGGGQFFDTPQQVPSFARRREELLPNNAHALGSAGAAAGLVSTAAVPRGIETAAPLGNLGATSVGQSLISAELGAVQHGELERHIRSYLETARVPPLPVIQLFFKAEPRNRQEDRIPGRRDEVVRVESALLKQLKAVLAEEEQVLALDYSIGLSVSSMVRQLNIPGTLSSGARRKVSGHDIVAKIPAFEKLFRLLLNNPRYMIAMYKVYVARSNDLKSFYFELVESLYTFGDQHSEHLFLVLANSILHNEIQAFMEVPNAGDGAQIAEAAPGHGMSVGEWSNGDSDARGATFGLGGGTASQHGRRSLQSFLHKKMKCPSFIQMATMLCSQPKVTAWVNKHFEGNIRDLFRGQHSRTAAGKEINLSWNPIKIYEEIHHDKVSHGKRAVQFQQEAASYPEVREELENRLRALRDFTLEFFNQIVKVSPDLPPQVRMLCKILHEQLLFTFQSDGSGEPVQVDQAIAKFLIDQLFLPAFLAPKNSRIFGRGSTEITEQQRLNLLSVVNLLQDIVIDRVYPEEFLEPLNVTVRQLRGQVQTLVSSLLSSPVNLLDSLTTDMFKEYLRPREKPLTLLVPTRTLKFVRYALKHDSTICNPNQPGHLRDCVYSEGGILATEPDVIAANTFNEEYPQLKSDSTSAHKLSLEMRFLNLAEASNLRDGICVDPESRVPVPRWMVDKENVATLDDPSEEDQNADPAVRKLQKQIVALPELSPQAGLPELRSALKLRLDGLLRESEYSKAQDLHEASLKLDEIISAQGREGFDSLLRDLLVSLLDRREADNRLAIRLASAKSLIELAVERIKVLRDQQRELVETLESIKMQPHRGLETRQPRASGGCCLKPNALLHEDTRGEFVAQTGTALGAFGRYSLKQLIDRKVVLAVEPKMGGDLFKQNAGGIQCFFSSTKTGIFEVSLVLHQDAIISRFTVVMSWLADQIRIGASVFSPHKVPLKFSVPLLKQLLEDITLRQLEHSL